MTTITLIRGRMDALAAQADKARQEFARRAVAGDGLDALGKLAGQLAAADAAAGELRAELRRQAVAALDSEIARRRADLISLTHDHLDANAHAEAARAAHAASEERRPRAAERIRFFAAVAQAEEVAFDAYDRYTAARGRLQELEALRDRGQPDQIAIALPEA